MKKILSLMLALAMLFCMTAAAESTEATEAAAVSTEGWKTVQVLSLSWQVPADFTDVENDEVLYDGCNDTLEMVFYAEEFTNLDEYTASYTDLGYEVAASQDNYLVFHGSLEDGTYVFVSVWYSEESQTAICMMFLCADEDAFNTAVAILGTVDTGSASGLVDGQTYGEGAVAFTLVVTDMDENTVTVTVNTDMTTVGDALVALEIIDGTPSSYGLYVTTVNGITLDWDKDQAYWAFYIDGEYAETGVDSTDVVAGATYSFVATKG